MDVVIISSDNPVGFMFIRIGGHINDSYNVLKIKSTWFLLIAIGGTNPVAACRVLQ